MRQHRLYILLALIVFSCYFHTLFNGFSSIDDGQYVLQNHHVNTGISLKNIKWAFTSNHASNWHPITWLSLQLDNQFFQQSPLFMHLVSLVIHCLNTLLLFFLLVSITRQKLRSWWVACIFGIHPVHIESIIWISERKDVLFMFFLLLSVFFYFRFKRSASIKAYTFSLFLFCCSLMSKPMGISLPIILILLVVWLDNRPLEKASWKGLWHRHVKTLIEMIPFFLLSLFSGITTIFVQSQGAAIQTLEALPLETRVLNAFLSYIIYFYKIFIPQPLAHFYPMNTQFLHLHRWAIVILIIVFILVLSRLAHKNKHFTLGGIWFLITLFPVIGFLHVGQQAYADRYAYLPYIGMYIALVWTLFQFSQNEKTAHIGLSAFTVTLMILNVQYSKKWVDPLTLNKHTLRVTSRNHVIIENQSKLFKKMGLLSQSIDLLEKALQNDTRKTYLYELCHAYFIKGDLENAQIIVRQLVEAAPDDVNAHIAAAHIYYKSNQIDDFKKTFLTALELKACDEIITRDFVQILFENGFYQDIITMNEKNEIRCGVFPPEVVVIIKQCRQFVGNNKNLPAH